LGVALAVLTQLVPALRATSRFTLESVASAASRVPSTRQPWPLRFGLDGVFLALAAIVAALNARNGYHVVVVPEGVPVASVNYGALLAPAFAWPGLVLLAWRLTAAAARRRSGRWAPARSRHAPELVAATVRRRRQVIARGAAGLTAAIGLGASTAIFVATYDQQSHLDVALTVGADVAAKAAPGVTATPREVALASSAPGVTGVQSMLHEFAYVGPDLQDIFGVDPARIASVVSLQDSFVPGSTIAATMHALGATPDGVLLSGETIRDYQLRPGDLIRLRLQSRPNGPFRTVPFHVVGQITEFPTAPRDSFIVADAHYLQRVTHWPGATTLLLSSSDPTRTASSLHRSFGAGWAVQDVVSARNSVITASGLAATDLGALARLDLGFALAFSLACAALAIGLGISERRRAFVVLTALGASASQRARFSDAEGVLLMVSGIVCGAGVGLAIGYLLVAVLNGIFDPPPDGLVVPAALLSLLGLAVVVLGSTVLKVTGWLASRFTADRLRDL
jgi:putative ABC transport system permease protein